MVNPLPLRHWNASPCLKPLLVPGCLAFRRSESSRQCGRTLFVIPAQQPLHKAPRGTFLAQPAADEQGIIFAQLCTDVGSCGFIHHAQVVAEKDPRGFSQGR